MHNRNMSWVYQSYSIVFAADLCDDGGSSRTRNYAVLFYVITELLDHTQKPNSSGYLAVWVGSFVVSSFAATGDELFWR